MKDPQLISVVVPVHCEVATVGPLVEALREAFRSVSCEYEIIFVDDGSTDGTWPALQALAESGPELSALRLARRFGKVGFAVFSSL